MRKIYVHFVKRFLDFFASLLGLPFLFLLIIVIGPIIKMSDGGPIFFVSKRIGLNGKSFNMIKFRSMKVNSPDIRLSDGSTYNAENDVRVTKIGKVLRKTSIDEIPQLLNVLFGKMSFIGPRPDPLDWLDRYPEDTKIFLSVRPGITGYNQAYFRNGNDGEAKMKNDVYYALHCSFLLDLKIFIKTIITVMNQQNMYK